ncbi:MAG TPA: GAF domain-containing protein, partial [Anaerolineae bacterium]|nr:GAF domain-containing protein [Anaerolineae bacterium]
VVVQSQQLLAETQTTLKQLDAINRRLTGQAWRDYTMTNGSLRIVDAGLGVPTTANNLSESVVNADRVQVVGPIGDTRSGLIAPIALRGEVIGALSLQEIDKDREWTENEITLLQTVANDVAVAIENARLIEQTERRAERELVISDVSTRMFAANDLNNIVKLAGDELARVLHAARTEVQISGEYLSLIADEASIDDHHGQ